MTALERAAAIAEKWECLSRPQKMFLAGAIAAAITAAERRPRPPKGASK